RRRRCRTERPRRRGAACEGDAATRCRRPPPDRDSGGRRLRATAVANCGGIPTFASGAALLAWPVTARGVQLLARPEVIDMPARLVCLLALALAAVAALSSAASAGYPGANGAIVFQSAYRGGKNGTDLWLRSPSGKLTDLTNGAGTNTEPAVS